MTLDEMVDWMRKRGVGQMSHEGTTIALSTLAEPADIEAAARAAAEREQALTSEERAQREREDRARKLYGPMVRRKEHD